MSCDFTQIVMTKEGRTFYKGEPGKPPELILKDVPASWINNGKIILHIALARNGPNGIEPLTHVPRLASPMDRRFNKENNMVANYVTVCREINHTNVYSITFSKNLPLSHHYKGQSSDLTTMFVHIRCNHHSIMSEPFVIKSKRQPDVLDSIKRGRDTEQDTYGCKRQKRSEQLKTLRNDNQRLIAQYKQVSSDNKRLEHQNEVMKQLLQNLYDMSKIGQTDNNVAIAQCFNITVNNIENMHWMKKKQSVRHL